MGKNVVEMRLEILGDITDSSKDDIFRAKLNEAEAIALNTLYPFDKEVQELPDDKRINNWLTRCAIELYRKIGTANVQSYSENGLSVSFMEGLVSRSLMNELIPKAGVPK